MNQIKGEMKETKAELEAAVEETDLFKIILDQTLGGDYEITEKDARKHAIDVCIKNLKN